MAHEHDVWDVSDPTRPVIVVAGVEEDVAQEQFASLLAQSQELNEAGFPIHSHLGKPRVYEMRRSDAIDESIE